MFYGSFNSLDFARSRRIFLIAHIQLLTCLCVADYHFTHLFARAFAFVFCIARLLQILVTASRNLVLRHWDWTSGVVVRSWKVLAAAD